MDQLNTNGEASVVSVSSAPSAANTDAVYEDKISKLAKLTQRGTIEWHVVDASSVPTLSFARVLTAYEASFSGEKLRLIETGYEKRSQFGDLMGSILTFPVKTNEMTSVVLSLYLVDRNGRPTFRFPSVEAIDKLLGEIKSKHSNVTDFLEAIDAVADATSG